MKPVFCDNHILVLEKPAGIATQPDFHEMARSWVKENFKKPGNVFLEPIHRIDKPVGGLVLFARTSKALTRLNESMRKKECEKTYLAKVEGTLPPKGTLVHHLSHGNFRAVVDREGKEAILHYKVRPDGLLEIILETGRYHQIRAQFSAIGHPIVGDEKYGSLTKSPAIALQHYRFVFPHPITKERLTFEVEEKLSSF